MGTTQTQQTTNVMDAIITDFKHECIFQTFGSIDNHSVVIVSKPYLKRTELYVNKQVSKTIENTTFAQLADLQQEAFEAWLKIQN